MSIVIEDKGLKPQSALQKRKKTTEVILHCTADPEGRDNTVEKIDATHKKQGWAMIGYHYVVDVHGKVYRGRPEQMVGSHAQGHNSTSIGVCYVGGMDKEYKNAKDTRTDEQKAAMYDLVHHLLRVYGLTINNVHCHNEYASKACPSFSIEQFRKEYEEYWKP